MTRRDGLLSASAYAVFAREDALKSAHMVGLAMTEAEAAGINARIRRATEELEAVKAQIDAALDGCER